MCSKLYQAAAKGDVNIFVNRGRPDVAEDKYFQDVGTKVAEARTCKSASHKFKGTCVSKSNCANVCKTEGFPAGHCRGLRRRCFCVKNCA